ncbi:Aste57867_23780 [Aphanomyces stellatus]|uniref:Aste57867_23780 protein n=1 Tax=Aphanomyces stellatus TaxID=120398 RepID=A0A485LPP9_9STRA|nr:hypothetical protein As57867_023707 [Aphanomyces stellatus]VFU00425.1 Aste57867_23780 [Aphanomyces stellatus]
MDNTKYHKSPPSDTPKYAWKKTQLQQACHKYGILYSNDDAKSTIWKKIAEYTQRHVVPVVVQTAASRGHQVVFTPPHHLDLQPIELVWASVKGDVGRQYTTETTFKDVFDRLNRAFNQLTPSTIHGCIAASNRRVLDLCSFLDLMDAEEVNLAGSPISSHGSQSSRSVPSSGTGSRVDSSGKSENGGCDQIWVL